MDFFGEMFLLSTIAAFVAFFVFALTHVFAHEYLINELSNYAKYATNHEPKYRDSSWLRKLAYKTIRIRNRHSPSGFNLEGTVLGSPFLVKLDTVETLEEANERISRIFMFADKWLELEKDSKVLGKYRS